MFKLGTVRNIIRPAGQLGYGFIHVREERDRYFSLRDAFPGIREGEAVIFEHLEKPTEKYHKAVNVQPAPTSLP